MGNSLCKEPREGSSMRPGRVFDSFGNIMCPNGLGKNKHGINKTYLSRHVLETTSKTNTLTSWNIPPTDSPDSAKVIDTPPVAPPRKKRNTLERGTSPEAMLKVKNGFKDVFGAESRRQSCDKRKPSGTVDKALPAVASSSFAIDVKDEEFSDFSKVPTKAEMDTPKEEQLQNGSAKVSRVGNKKSDKFLGENLSDALSEDPVVIERRKSAKKELPDLDKIDEFIEKNVLNVAAKPKAEEIPKIKITADAKKGNKKSTSDPPKTQAPVDVLDGNELTEDSLMKYIDESVGSTTSLGKKAEFLMAMLEDYPEDRYEGMAPVEEPVIIPRKRKTRHICDNDEHMHAMLHKHDHEVDAAKNLITTEASIETPPRKPDRDFSKYLAPGNFNNEDSDDSCSSRPIRKRSVLQAPPSPPVRQRMPKNLSETEFRGNISDATTSTPKKLETPIEVKAHSPRTLKRIISMPTSIGLVKTETRTPSPRPVLLKSNSSSSFLNMDLHQAHMKVVPFTPQHPCHQAPDDLVEPKSRLVTRKISTKSSDGTPCTQTPTLELPSPTFTIGSSEVLSSPSNVDPPPPPVPKRKKSSTEDQGLPLSRDLLGYDLGGFLVSSNILQHHDVTQVLNIVNNDKDNGENILKEFQVYLEDQINIELNNSTPKYPITTQLLQKLDRLSEPEGKLEDISIDLVESDNSNKSSDMDDCFDPEFEKIEKTDVEELRNTDSLPSSSDAESVIEGSDQLGSMVAVKAGSARMGRRESIEDVDSWFKNHIATNQADEQIIGLRKQRRGSDGFLAYDMTRQYPFGEVRRRHDSHSAELFEDITKLHDLGSEEEVNTKTHNLTVKDDRIRNRRGSDGLIFYDTSRKFPFGEPNENLPKAIEKEMANKMKSNNESKQATATNTLHGHNDERQKAKEQDVCGANSDHSTLLKFLSNEKLAE